MPQIPDRQVSWGTTGSDPCQPRSSEDPVADQDPQPPITNPLDLQETLLKARNGEFEGAGPTTDKLYR